MKSTISGTEPKGLLELGLVASADSGFWMIAVDQTTSGAERWFLQIKGPSAHLYIEIPSTQVIDQAASLFAARSSPGLVEAHTAESFDIGEFAGLPVALVFDDEFRDRCFLLIADGSCSTLRFTIVGADFVSLAAAMCAARDQLGKDGWLT
jgi:hypothetical protein